MNTGESKGQLEASALSASLRVIRGNCRDMPVGKIRGSLRKFRTAVPAGPRYDDGIATTPAIGRSRGPSGSST
jgi:hypothetical protein